MFPHGFCFAGRVAARGALGAGGTAVIAWTLVHAIIHQTRAKKKVSGLRSQGLPFATWTRRERPIVVAGLSCLSHRTVAILVIEEHSVDRDRTVITFDAFDRHHF